MITDYWKDTGTPEDIINANKAILENIIPEFKGEKQSLQYQLKVKCQ